MVKLASTLFGAIDVSTAGREVMWNVSSIHNAVLMYLMFFLSLCFVAFAIARRVKLWSGGKSDNSRFKYLGKRIGLLFRDVLGQRRVNRDRESASFHALIYWGFLALLFTTTMVFIDHDLGIEIYHGRFYLGVTLFSDIFGLFLLFGLGVAYHRRTISGTDRVHTANPDIQLLLILGTLTIQGFILEGLRIHVTNDPWRYYSPIGWLVSEMFWMLSPSSARLLHFITWWSHVVTFFAAFAVIPYTKLFHIISSSTNLVFQRVDRPKGAMNFPGDLEKALEEATGDDEFSIGVSTLQDMTWKQRLDLDACTSCGRCQEVCPAYNSGKVLSPKWLILDARNHMLKLHASGAFDAERSFMSTLDGQLLSGMYLPSDDVDKSARAKNVLVQNAAREVGKRVDAQLAGEVMDPDVFWSCTTCRACMHACPVGIEHVDLITDVRRSLTLMQGELPTEAQSSLRAIETRGNPFGPAQERFKWSQGLDVRVLNAGDEVDVLYWVGCISAYDTRKQKIARSMVKILNASGVSWGVLGDKESCTGDPARRLGEENLFQSQAKKNLEQLLSIRVKTIVANCPHCFNTLKNEYSQLNDGRVPFEVIHHSHLITKLMSEGKLSVSESDLGDYTFHDPCYLGRYNDTYDEPRDVLVKIGGPRLNEMRDSRERGLCCGAGGGHFWFDMKVGERVNVQRVNQAAETNVGLVATACPFCMHMIEDGTKLTNRESSLQVRDIAEIVADALSLN